MGSHVQVIQYRLQAYIWIGMVNPGRAVGTATDKHGGYREKFYP